MSSSFPSSASSWHCYFSYTHTPIHPSFPFFFFPSNNSALLLYFSNFLFFLSIKELHWVWVRGMSRMLFHVFLGYFLECHATNLMCWARVYKPKHSKNIPSSINEQNVSLHVSIEQWLSSWNKISQSHNGVLIWVKSPQFLSLVPSGDLCIPCGFHPRLFTVDHLPMV